VKWNTDVKLTCSLRKEGKQKHRDLGEIREIFRNSVKDAATKTLGFQISENVRKPWITQEMIEKWTKEGGGKM